MTLTDPQGHEVPTEHVVPRMTIGEAARQASAAAARAVAGRGRTSEEVSALIEKFGRHPDGYLHAQVLVSGRRFYFHRRYGSWLAPGQVGRNPVVKEPEALLGSELGRELKFALSEKSKPYDHAERRRREEREEQHARQATQPAKSPEDSRGDSPAGSAGGLPGVGDSDRASEPVSPD